MQIYISILTELDDHDSGEYDPPTNRIACCGMLALTPKLGINKIITLEDEKTILLSMEKLFNDLTPHQIYVDDMWVYERIRDRSIAHGIPTPWAVYDHLYKNRFLTIGISSWIETEDRLTLGETCKLMGIPIPYGDRYYSSQIEKSCMAMSMINLRMSYQRGSLNKSNYVTAAEKLLNTYMGLTAHTEWTSSFMVEGKTKYLLE